MTLWGGIAKDKGTTSGYTTNFGDHLPPEAFIAIDRRLRIATAQGASTHTFVNQEAAVLLMKRARSLSVFERTAPLLVPHEKCQGAASLLS